MTVGSKVKQTISSLKGTKGTLELYALKTRDEETSCVYKEAVRSISEILEDLEKRLQVLESEEPQYKGL